MNDPNLARYLQGEISFTEWQHLKSLQRQSSVPGEHGDSVMTSISSTPVTASSVDVGAGGDATRPTTSGDDVEITEITGQIAGMSSQVKDEPPDEYQQPQPEEDDDEEDDDDVIIVDTETTIKYLRGEIPFEEYQSMLESRIQIKEEPDEINTDIGAEETVTTSSTGDEQPGQPGVPKKKGPRKGIRKHKLPRDLQGLMGEANMKFARGEHEEAVKMCMEVIRLAPTAPEPFQTLGMLYEELGDNNKALQFLLIAAHLNPSDSEEWVRLAEMSLEVSNTKQAISCYDKAIKYDHDNMSLWWGRCDLFERIGDQRKAMEGYQQILSLIPKENGDKYFQLARDMAKNFHMANDIQKALATMTTAFKEQPTFVTAEDVNLLLELYISQGVHDKPMEILIQHCGVVFTFQDGSKVSGSTGGKIKSKMSQPTSCEVPDEMPIDLRMKLVVCLIHMQFKNVIQATVAPLFEENPDEVGDLYLDVAEAYMETGEYKKAEPILAMLTDSEKYNLAAVWLRYGECLSSLGQLQKAAVAYGKVVQLAPSHMAARVSLSGLQQQLGQYDEALQTLEQEEQGEEQPRLDLRLMLPRCMLLYSQHKWDSFISCSRQVLFRYFKDIFNPNHLAVILSNRSLKHRIQALRNVMGSKIEQHIQDTAAVMTDAAFTVDDLWDLYLKLCEVLIQQRKFTEFQDVGIVALVSPQFMQDSTKANEADFICLVACLLNKNGHFAYNFIREICVKQLDNNNAWNLFCQVITMSQDLRHNRFCLRLMLKHPNHLALSILNGHNALVAGTYKHALGEYVVALRQDPHDPLIPLCIGLTFIHMASQKFASKRHSLTMQGCAFLNTYLELRGENQEAYYNLGRAMHQLGLLHAAVFYYNKVLEIPPSVKDSNGMFDLSREATFNLSLIYQNSGSTELATMLIQKYLVI